MPTLIGTIVSWLVIFIVCGGLYGCPQYNVYSSRLDGEAQLAKAESTRRTRVLEAQAEFDSAGKKADAEVIRAQGVAKANQILADSLGGAEGYLRWKYIEMLEQTGSHGRDVIYVPTEASLPILESGRAAPKK